MTDILLTNDDGYKSIGFFPLLKELSKEFSVVAITSPDRQLWRSKSITARKELDLKKVEIDGFDIFLVNGKPADFVQIGIHNILRKKPKMVVSGINTAPNVGISRTLSSGTVGAAMEASLCGVKAIASSYCLYPDVYLKRRNKINLFDPKNYLLFKNAVEITVKLTKILIEKDFSKDVDLFSINIPYKATKKSDFKMTKLFRDSNWRLFHKRNNKFIHRSPLVKTKDFRKITDLKALNNGKISITPISLELTSEKLLKKYERIVRKEW